MRKAWPSAPQSPIGPSESNGPSHRLWSLRSADKDSPEAEEITGLCLVCDDELVEWGMKEKVQKKKAAEAPEELKARCSMCMSYDVCKLFEKRTWGR